MLACEAPTISAIATRMPPPIRVTGWASQVAEVGAAGVVGVVGDRRQVGLAVVAPGRLGVAHGAAAYLQARLQHRGSAGGATAAGAGARKPHRDAENPPRGAG